MPPLLGQPTIRIDIDRQRAARYGLSPGDINATIQAAVGGQAAGDLYENGSDRHFPMKVRLAAAIPPRTWRRCSASPSARQGPNGGVVQVPLAEVATIGLSTGAFYIYREQQERYIPVKFSVRGRDLGGAVLEAQEKVAEEVKLPSGYRLDWAGDFANFQNAIDRLSIAVPIAIAPDPAAALCQLRHLARHAAGRQRHPDGADRRHPRACTLADMSFSISAAIGFVALFGIAAMNGIMVVGCFNRLIDAGLEREAALRETCEPADAARADDLRGGLRRPAAGRLLDRDRQPGPAPARHRRGRRHAAGADPVPHRAAGGDRLLLPPPRPGYI